MSNSRDYHYSPHQQSSSRRSSPQDSSAGLFANIGQGGRPVLPPLPSPPPTSQRSPAPTPHPSQYPVQRSYPSQSHYEYGLPASYNQSSGEWYNNPATAQPQTSSYSSSYQEQQQRYPSPYHSQSSRTAQSTPAADNRHAPAGSSHQTIAWSGDERYSQNYSYAPAQPAHNAGYDSTRYQAPTPSYPASYTYHPGNQMASTPYSYANTSAYEPRNASSQVPYADPMGPAHAAASRSVSGPVARTTRAHTHASYAPYHPYTRHHPHASTSSLVPRTSELTSEELAIKKKRKRADANQLKVLNEVYDRNPFPPTAERESLAVQLGMTPRSVQIWFQNKRQAARQGGRTSTTSTMTTPTTRMGGSADPSMSPSLPGPSANVHSSSLAHAVGVPSASAPRGSAGYVASPPRIIGSPPRMTTGSGIATSRAGSTTAGSSSTYTLRTSSPEDRALAAAQASARTTTATMRRR